MQTNDTNSNQKITINPDKANFLGPGQIRICIPYTGP